MYKVTISRGNISDFRLFYDAVAAIAFYNRNPGAILEKIQAKE